MTRERLGNPYFMLQLLSLILKSHLKRTDGLFLLGETLPPTFPLFTTGVILGKRLLPNFDFLVVVRLGFLVVVLIVVVVEVLTVVDLVVLLVNTGTGASVTFLSFFC